VEELHHVGVGHPLKTLLAKFGVGEQTRHVHQRQAVFDQHNQGCRHHVGEVRRLLQALWPRPPEGFQHRCRNVVWVFSSGGQDVKRDDIVCAGGVDVDQPVADIGVSEDASGDKQPE